MTISNIIKNINYPSLKRTLNKENETKQNVESLIERTESWQKNVMRLRIFLSVITFGIINFFYLLGAAAKNSSLKHQGKDDLVPLNFVKSHRHEADKVIKNFDKVIKNFEKISKKQKQIVTAEMETISEVTINTKVEKETIETKTSITKAEMEIITEKVDIEEDVDFKNKIASCKREDLHLFNKKSNDEGKGKEGEKLADPTPKGDIFKPKSNGEHVVVEMTELGKEGLESEAANELVGEERSNSIIGIGAETVNFLTKSLSAVFKSKEKEEVDDIENQFLKRGS